MFFKDFQRLKRLGTYLRKDRRSLSIILLIMIPVALAGAIQPLLVGQAISVLKGEPTLSLLNGLSIKASIRFLVGSLLISVLLRLALQGYQSYNIQRVGQRLTARIRADLFSHAMALSLRYHDSMPVGKLLTRLTSDVDALSEVFGSGAVGVIADVVSLLVIAITMLLIDLKLGLLLLLTQVPVIWLILWLQKKIQKGKLSSS